MSKFVFPLLAVALVLGGCVKKTPCEALAASVCGGGSAVECDNLKRLTKDAAEETQGTCRQIVDLLPKSGKSANACDELASMVCSERPLEDCLNMRKEAAGADDNKIKICAQFKVLIENTRKTNAEKSAAEKAAKEKAAMEKPAAENAAPAPQVQPQAASPSETN